MHISDCECGFMEVQIILNYVSVIEQTREHNIISLFSSNCWALSWENNGVDWKSLPLTSKAAYRQGMC